MAQVVIVGAGITGLATAYHLQELLPQADITVLEAQPRPGGNVWTERRDGFQVELGPNGFPASKLSTLKLCQQLDLTGELLPASADAKLRYLYLNGRLHEVPVSVWQMFRSPLLSWNSKWRLFAEGWQARRTPTADESVYDFVARRVNLEVADLMADALVTGIYAGDAKLLSMAAAFPRVARCEQEYGSVRKGLARMAKARRAEAAALGLDLPRKATLFSFKRGLRFLVEMLAVKLRKAPQFSTAVRNIAYRTDLPGKPSWMAATDGQHHWQADALVLTCPAYRQAAMLADLDPDLADLMLQIPYSPAVVVALGYREHPMPTNLKAFGYITPQRTRRDVLGVQFCSSIFPERAPDGCFLLRAICGGWHRRNITVWDDDQLSLAVRREMRQILGISDRPIFMHITRWDRAIPQYTLGHLERIAQIETQVAQHKGLFLGGNAYQGVSLNDCTEQAEIMARKVAAYLKAKEPEG
jgi:protoporphyrinogen/coproporphyrinogen III oxidase